MSEQAQPRSDWTSLLKRGTLGRRILLWFLILSLLPLLLSNTVGYGVSHRILEGQVKRYLRALAETQAQLVSHEIDRHLLRLASLIEGNPSMAPDLGAAAAEMRSAGQPGPVGKELLAHLDHELKEFPSYSEFVLLDASGVAAVTTDSQRRGSDWSQTRLFWEASRGPFFTEDWEWRHGVALPVFHVAQPITDRHGDLAGVFVATASFATQREFLHIPPHLAGYVETYIVARDGRPLFVSHAHLPLDFNVRLPSPLAEEPAGSTAAYTNYEGEEVLGISTEIPGLDWKCIAEAPIEAAFGQLLDLRILSAVLEGVFALALVAIVWFVARSIVSPLRRLVTAAERIRRGDMGVEVKVDREDELGQLGHTFNQMSQGLERSAAEIQELHAQQMLRAGQLASVGELASGIAHEIKNPAASIASGIDLLARELEDDVKAEGIVRLIRAQLKRIESAVSNLLSYARPRRPHAVWADVQQIVDRSAALVKPQAEAANVRIETRQEGALPRVQVDTELLTQALVNLALNGIQAMRDGGVLGITTEYRDDAVRISVTDTGTGMGEDQLQKIFRPFFTTKHRGTGLGLAITRGIVERHGGRIEVVSRIAEGSSFTLVIPVAPKEAA
jgi:signal transduction histidine kinase